MRTVRNILRHELIGLDCTIVDSANKNQIGINGSIVDETIKTIVIRDSEKKMKRIQKAGTTFRVKLSENEIVEIDGNYIVSRPEDRIKKVMKKW